MTNPKTPHPTDIAVGNRIRVARLINRMSQEKLGKELGITFQQIQKYEKGTNRVTASRLLAICTLFNIEISWLFQDVIPDSITDSEPRPIGLGDDDELRLVAAYRKTAPEHRPLMIGIARSMQEVNRKSKTGDKTHERTIRTGDLDHHPAGN